MADVGSVDYETITPKDFLPKWPSDFCDYFKEIGEIMAEEPVSYYMPRDSCAKLFPKALTDAPVTEIVSISPVGALDELMSARVGTGHRPAEEGR